MDEFEFQKIVVGLAFVQVLSGQGVILEPGVRILGPVLDVVESGSLVSCPKHEVAGDLKYFKRFSWRIVDKELKCVEIGWHAAASSPFMVGVHSEPVFWG